MTVIILMIMMILLVMMMVPGPTAGIHKRRGELPSDQGGPGRAATAGGEVRAVGVQEQVQ